MRKWNRYAVIAAAIVAMGIFTACTSKEPAETTAVETTAEQTSTEDLEVKEPETIDDREMVTTGAEYGNPVVDLSRMVEDFTGLLGQSDASTVALLGEGQILPEEGEELSLRQYSMKVFDKETVTDVMYNEGKVVGIQLVPDAADMQTCLEQLTESLGEPASESDKENDGNTAQSVIWETENGQVELLDSYGTVSLQITPAV